MICVSVAKKDLVSNLEAVAGEKMAEIRIDQSDMSYEDVKVLFAQPLKLLATCRPGKFPEGKRMNMLKYAIEAGAAYVDIELEASWDFQRAIIEVAREHNCKVIISYHNYEETPERETLVSIMNDCFSLGADIAKLACMVNSYRDNPNLFSLYLHEKQVIAIGMGKKGRITRIAAPYMGAPFTYAALGFGDETAAGQIDKATLANIINIIGDE